jgi:hypothetical protein
MSIIKIDIMFLFMNFNNKKEILWINFDGAIKVLAFFQL